MNRPFVNGNREQTNNFTVDGFDVNETIDNRVAYQPSPDALAEISVETNNYAADIGNVGGAVVGSVIKSGTNSFRGNAFEFYRNSDFDANTWENNRSGAAKQERTQHIYGGTLGGPISSDKLFFFGDYQGSRQDAPGFGTASVAPEAWRRGDLSSVARASSAIRVTGQPFPGNQIPLDRISADRAGAAERPRELPAAEPHRPGGITGNYVGETLLTIRAHQGDARRRLERLGQRQALRPLLVCDLRGQARRATRSRWSCRPATTSRSGTSASTGTASSARRSINELLVGFSHTRVLLETYDWAGVGDGNARYGIAGGQPIAGLSQINCGSGLTLPGAIAPDSDTLAKTYQINEKLTWLNGRHTLKFGGQFLRYDQRRFYAGNNGLLGFITFNGAFTGFAFADFLLDLVVGQRPRRRRSRRPVDAPAEPHRRSSCRTTSSCART